jgi:hypothetical protein
MVSIQSLEELLMDGRYLISLNPWEVQVERPRQFVLLLIVDSFEEKFIYKYL